MCILLIGFMGAGKTTILQQMKKEKVFQNIQFLDLDEEVEKCMKDSVEHLIEQSGISMFRTIESELLHKLCAPNTIISCGGGIVEPDINEELLNQQCCIFLDAPKEVLFRRIQSDQQMRPVVYDPVHKQYRKEYFFDLYEKRKELYEKFADLTIETETIDVESAIREIVEYCKSKNPWFF